MRQSWLPGFPDGAQKVGEGLAILEKDGQAIYFVGGDNYFSHPVGDDAGRRFALTSWCGIRINLLFDATRKVIELTARLSADQGMSDWRQHAYNVKHLNPCLTYPKKPLA